MKRVFLIVCLLMVGLTACGKETGRPQPVGEPTAAVVVKAPASLTVSPTWTPTARPSPKATTTLTPTASPLPTVTSTPARHSPTLALLYFYADW